LAHLRPGETEVNSVVGVRHQELERLVSELRGDKPHNYVPPSISTPLSYLFPDKRYRTWPFRGGTADIAVARDLVTALENYCIPFMMNHTTLPDISLAFDQHLGFDDAIAYRRPLVALLSKDFEEARRLANESQLSLGGRTDLAAKQLFAFTEKLLARIETAG
jgi:hypothetical protein